MAPRVGDTFKSVAPLSLAESDEYDRAEAELSLLPSTLEHRDQIHKCIYLMQPILDKSGREATLRVKIRDRQERLERMLQIVNASQEVVRHDAAEQRKRRRLPDGMAHKATQTPGEDGYESDDRTLRKKRRCLRDWCLHKGFEKAKALIKVLNSFAAIMEAIKSVCPKGSALRSLERNGVKVPDYLYFPTSDFSVPPNSKCSIIGKGHSSHGARHSAGHVRQTNFVWPVSHDLIDI